MDQSKAIIDKGSPFASPPSASSSSSCLPFHNHSTTKYQTPIGMKQEQHSVPRTDPLSPCLQEEDSKFVSTIKQGKARWWCYSMCLLLPQKEAIQRRRKSRMKSSRSFAMAIMAILPFLFLRSDTIHHGGKNGIAFISGDALDFLPTASAFSPSFSSYPSRGGYTGLSKRKHRFCSGHAFWLNNFPALSATMIRNSESRPTTMNSGTGTLQRDVLVDPSSSAKPNTTTVTNQSSLQDQWDERIAQLRQFHKRHGHAKVTSKYNSDLYTWMMRVRYEYWHQIPPMQPRALHENELPQLSPHQLQTLQDLDFDWNIVPRDMRFVSMLHQLRLYHIQHGHTRVNEEKGTDSNVEAASHPELYTWTKYLQRIYCARRIKYPQYPRRQPNTQHGSNDTMATSQESIEPRRPRVHMMSRARMESLQAIGFFVDHQRPAPVSRWDIFLPQLQVYYDLHGHSNVTNSHGEAEEYSELCRWTQYIRSKYHRSAALQCDRREGNSVRRQRLGTKNQAELPPERLEALQKVDFNWKVKPQSKWHEMFPKLQAFYEEHGHVDVAFVMRTEEEDSKEQIEEADYDAHRQELQQLLKWTKHLMAKYGGQIRNFKSKFDSKNYTNKIEEKGKSNQLSDAKLESLHQLGCTGPTTRLAAFEGRWSRQYQALQVYHQVHGHCRVSPKRNKRLANFAYQQRTLYRRYMLGQTTTLTLERIRALEALGFDWGRPCQDQWKERLAELKQYADEFGHCNVPQNYEQNPALGQWCMNQRQLYRRNRIAASTYGAKASTTSLTSERQSLLVELGFEWNYKNALWNNRLERLRVYAQETETVRVPIQDVSNSDLRLWVIEQRFLYKNKHKRMTEERMSALENTVPKFFEWPFSEQASGPSKEDWSELFVAIQEKGIQAGGKAKKHWFDGNNRFEEVKTEFTEQELLALWNEENDDEDDEFFEDDEDGRKFLRA